MALAGESIMAGIAPLIDEAFHIPLALYYGKLQRTQPAPALSSLNLHC